MIGVPDAIAARRPRRSSSCATGAEPFTLEALRGFLADKLGRHEMPAAVEFRDSLPRTAVGKLSRKELADEERPRARRRSKAAA